MKIALTIILFMAAGCYSHPKKAEIQFIDANTVCINGVKFDVTDKTKGFEVRKSIKDAEIISFLNVELSDCKSLWNIIYFYWPLNAPMDISAADYDFILSNNQQVEVFFGPVSSYFYQTSDLVGISVPYNKNVDEIDFNALTNNFPCSDMYLEILCDEEKAKGVDIIPKIEKFIKTGTGNHFVFLPFY